jgi:hypothetical protein
MKIGYFWPAFRGVVHAVTAQTMHCDSVWAVANGHVLEHWTLSNVNIAVARNQALQISIASGHERLLMVDDDSNVIGSGDDCGLARLMRSMDATRAAAVGAVFASP